MHNGILKEKGKQKTRALFETDRSGAMEYGTRTLPTYLVTELNYHLQFKWFVGRMKRHVTL